ncbi:MAG: hypothetical protein HFH62_01930 [Lachnospiraceae bacterium]|nr:hypothetical protein [Lachnospiraceae bacterium]
MKKMGYLFFAFIFQICRCIPVQQRKVVLYNGHFRDLSGNLLAMKQEIMRHRDDVNFFYYGKRTSETGGAVWKMGRLLKFFFQLPYQMATAGQVFLNDNFLPLRYCRPSERTQMIQLWHGAGAFKRFGLSAEKDRKVREQVKRANRRITHLFVTSKQVIPFYSEAFAISYEKIFATGIPVTDLYCDKSKMEQGKNRFFQEYPELEEKKLLLVAPTFRDTPEENRLLLDQLVLERLEDVLGEEWVILLRMHPKYPIGGFEERERCRNLTGYPHVSDLYFASDMMLTDYSSTMVEYVLLNKPMIFYAYDLEKYNRGFYWDYEEGVPGSVAHNTGELLDCMEAVKMNLNGGERPGEREILTGEEKRERFRRMQYDYTDDASAERIWKVLEGRRKQCR